MGTENLTLKIRLLILAWFHFRSQTGSTSYLVKKISYKDIKKATDGFKRVNSRTYCSQRAVSYNARFQNGSVATVREIKISDDDNEDEAFCKEVQLLGCLHHRHIVALTGFSSGTKRFLVYENMERGSLKEHLSDPLKTPLNWRTRLQIAVGIAAALEYLHFFCDPPVYHVSINSSTILLDENLIAKISDVSLHTTTPQNLYRCSKECTEQECKDMIFQLGLLILELVTGQCSEKGGMDLVQWVKETHVRGRSFIDKKMIDPDLGNSYDLKELHGLLSVARLCITSVDKRRIYTSQILRYVQKKIGISRS